jgi:anti-sigma regulatory factor (Ser/Thr protein kinase)
MEITPPIAPLTIDDPTQVSEARRTATRLAEMLGFDATASGNVALVVTEIGTNIVKHARGGEILLHPVEHGGVPGIDVVGLDRGPGIADLDRCVRDGYSTAGSPGTGLGAIRRLSAVFDVCSAPDRGTALLARVWAQPVGMHTHRALSVGVAAAMYPGETVSGDAWAVEQTTAQTVVLVVDGLGHGVVAAEAARESVRLFRANARRSACDIVQALHDGLRSTRGAAVAVAAVDPEHGVVRFAGLGNIAAAIVAPSVRRHLISHNGTAGYTVRRIDEFSYPWPKDGVLILHTDGLVSHWDLDRYPGLVRRSPSLIAGVLYRDFSRHRDDVTVVAVAEAAR